VTALGADMAVVADRATAAARYLAEGGPHP
jgi:hypothetical protein